MAERRWTEAQKNAIDIDGRTLLVSAAAGSGKTAVLTARIIRRLTDENSPADITRMLVVTFTKAAAGELRERIYGALQKASQASPHNRHLKKQLHAIGRARISTIHSFCLDLINSNFESLGLGAVSSVMNDYDAEVILRDIMENLISDCYDGRVDVGNFTEFIDNFSALRDDRTGELLIGFYNKLRSYPDGIDFIYKSAEERHLLDALRLMDTKAGEALRAYLRRFAWHHKKSYLWALDTLAGSAFEAYAAAYSSDLEFIERLEAEIDTADYEKLQELLSEYPSARLASVRKVEPDESILAIRSLRDDFKGELKKLREKYFSAPADFLCELEAKGSGILFTFHRFMCEFDRRYSERKRMSGRLDFADLERYAVKLLWDGDSPSEAARAVASRYDDIYIDEYQDVNELQDMIFRAVSRPDNRFMVGDIKQSIYGFRGADPDIFSRYRDSFPIYHDGDGEGASTLFLSNNFRCDRNIIEFSNLIFRSLFCNNSGKVPYYDEDDLIYSKEGDDGDSAPVRIVVIKKSEEDGEDSCINEAKYIAAEIKSLIMRGYKNGDITLLMRSPRANSFVYEEEIKKLGIDCRNEILRSLFESPEVLLMLCLLNCIDNPMRDVYLAGVLRSPLFGFSIDDLARLRLECPKGTLYEALTGYTERHAFEKGEYFLGKLANYRKYANGCPCDRLIWYLMCDTGMEALVYNDSDGDGQSRETRRANLMLLYEYSRRFESGAFRGLYNFIRYLEDIIASGVSLKSAQTSGEGEVVRILSIHQSKGLEFPVCFLCNSHHKFNREDSRANIIADKESGITLRIKDADGLVNYDTFSRRSALISSRVSQADEEMRILYVALTRAREMLYITAEDKEPEELIASCERDSRFISPHFYAGCDSMIKWILTAAASKKGDPSFTMESIMTPPDIRGQFDVSVGDVSVDGENDTEAYKALFSARFDYIYPHREAAAMPAKLSVSNLYPGVLDEGEDDPALDLTDERDITVAVPKFLSSEPERASSADRGTATHVFMQFCDFDSVERIGIDGEIERLIRERFIPESYGSLIERRELDVFFRSALYHEMRGAKEIHRELRFNIMLPASSFTRDEAKQAALRDESLFVQGVIDCVFVDSTGRLRLIDYKTDRVPKNDEGRAILIKRHSGQLGYYRLACERLFGRAVSSTAIYSFALGREVEVE